MGGCLLFLRTTKFIYCSYFFYNMFDFLLKRKSRRKLRALEEMMKVTSKKIDNLRLIVRKLEEEGEELNAQISKRFQEYDKKTEEIEYNEKLSVQEKMRAFELLFKEYPDESELYSQIERNRTRKEDADGELSQLEKEFRELKKKQQQLVRALS